MTLRHCTTYLFLSTLSLRRATSIGTLRTVSVNFYPRSPCGERQANAVDPIQPGHISIHALLAESDYITTITICTVWIFLSTLSLRRATIHHKTRRQYPFHFYPRSPCGERRNVCPHTRQHDAISIHALLAESDDCIPLLSIRCQISIHALLAESDDFPSSHLVRNSKFLSTLSLRRATRDRCM